MSDDMRRVARAIVAQALSDMSVGIAGGERVGISQPERAAARNFLLSERGSWRESREFWCSLADLDPEQLREKTSQFIERRSAVLAPPAPVAPIPPKPKPKKARAAPMRKRQGPLPCTKMADVLFLTGRPEGVATEELMKSLGWRRSTALAAISDLRLYGITAKRCDDGRYRLVSLP